MPLYFNLTESNLGLIQITIQVSGSLVSVMLIRCMRECVHVHLDTHMHISVYALSACMDDIPVFIDGRARHDKPLLIRDTTFTSRISPIII